MDQELSEKRLRVIMEQLLPGITEDIKRYDNTEFRVEYIDKLSATAHGLVEHQETYTYEDVDKRFNDTYRDVAAILNGKMVG